ncbi:27402_t:CDS:1, partial [Racocetra persica]
SFANEFPSLVSKIAKPQQIIVSLIKRLLEQNTFLVVGCEEMPNISSRDNPSLFHTSFSKEDDLFTENRDFTELFKKQPHL